MIASLAALVGMALLLAGDASADGFRTGIPSTRCNLDASRAQVNNPCPSLYNAECDGSYCTCPRGQVEHPNLHKCVPGDERDDQDNRNDRDHRDGLLEDLPFDYVPPGQTTTQRPGQQYNPSVDVTNTRCTAGNDPCPSLHSAICSRGYCVCPEGYMQDPNRATCLRDNSPRPHGGGFNRDDQNDHDTPDDHRDDHDGHNGYDPNDRNHDRTREYDSWGQSGSMSSNSDMMSMVASVLVCALMVRH